MLPIRRRPVCRPLALMALALLLAACGGGSVSSRPSADPGGGPDQNTPTYTISHSYTTVAHECVPHQAVHITSSTAIIQLIEPCGSVVVEGSTNQVVIASTGTLRIGGRNQHVTVKQVTAGVVQLGGRDNELVCQTGIQVHDTGSSNVSSGCTGSATG